MERTDINIEKGNKEFLETMDKVITVLKGSPLLGPQQEAVALAVAAMIQRIP